MKQIIILAFLFSSILNIAKHTIDFRPPGTVKVVDNFYVDEAELTNADWREYLYSIEEQYGKDSKEYKMNVPVLDNFFGEEAGPDIKQTYFWHPSYDDYPVVGISHAQAVNYCTWRTTAVIKMMERQNISNNTKFFYRLPSQAEWELITNGGYNAKQKKVIRKLNKKYDGKLRTTNMLYGDTDSNLEEQNSLTAPVRTYLPNKFGVYNLYGNVAEMISEPGIAMGGSYLHRYEEIVPTNKEINYEGPQNWLGFRCVCEIVD